MKLLFYIGSEDFFLTVDKNYSTTPTSKDMNIGTPDIYSIAKLNNELIFAAHIPYISTDNGVSFNYSVCPYFAGATDFCYYSTGLIISEYGGGLHYYTGSSWKEYIIPGYDGLLGIIANDIFVDNNKIYIAHNKGLVIGQLQ